MHLCVLRGSQNKQQFFFLHSINLSVFITEAESFFQRGTNWVFKLDRNNFVLNLLNPTGYVMHQQFNIQQLYVLPTLYLCVLYLSEKKTATCATYSIN